MFHVPPWAVMESLLVMSLRKLKVHTYVERTQAVKQWGIRVGLLGEEEVAGEAERKWTDRNELFKIPQFLQKYKQNLQGQFLTSCLKL